MASATRRARETWRFESPPSDEQQYLQLAGGEPAFRCRSLGLLEDLPRDDHDHVLVVCRGGALGGIVYRRDELLQGGALDQVGARSTSEKLPYQTRVVVHVQPVPRLSSAGASA